MNRLALEQLRLYPASTDGSVRACVLQLAAPADWPVLAVVWKAVQSELELPAPAIAVTGTDGFQLWFSLTVALPEPQARQFLQALQSRYLPDIPPERVALLTALDAAAAPPALQAGNGMWSAFIAPDLAPVMNDEPWVDVPPNQDGQAQLLARLVSIAPADLQRALQRLLPESAPAEHAVAMDAMGATVADRPDPTAFLLQVMKDPSVTLALRIEAAKALLPFMPLPLRRPP